MKKTFEYSAKDNLESMKEAVNYNRYQQKMVTKLIEQTNKKKVAVLDFGAGIGTYSDMIRSKNNKVDCFEIDKEEASYLRKKGYDVYAKFSDLTAKYDVIYTLNVLEHIENDQKALESLRESLSSDGKLLVYVPAFQILFSGLDIKADHYRRYRIKSLKKIALNAGLKVEEIKYGDPLGFFGALIYRIIGANGTLSPRSIKIFDTYIFPISTFIEPLFRHVLGKNVIAVFSVDKTFKRQ